MPWTEKFVRIPIRDSRDIPKCSTCRRIYNRSRPAMYWKMIQREGSSMTTPVPYCRGCKKTYELAKQEEHRESAKRKLDRQRERRRSGT